MNIENVLLKNHTLSKFIRLAAVFFAAIVLMVGSMVCRGQENYVRTSVFTQPMTVLPDSLDGVARTSITYYDGLGRPVQTVKQRAGGNRRNEREKVISTVGGGSSPSYTFKATGYTRVGDFVLEDYLPTKVYIDGGYVDLFVISPTSVLTTYNYYIHDNHGSVRAVVNQSGNVVQATDYSAYGVPSTRYKMTADNRLHLLLQSL